nr:hypothetical protein [Actinomycetota bacterium]
AQVEVIHDVYTPSPQEVEWATRVLRAAESAERGGLGVFMLEGRMVDRPVMEQARQIYEAARRYEQELAPPRVASARPEEGSSGASENG